MGAAKGSIPWNKGTAKGYVNERGYLCIKKGDREFKVHRLVMEEKLGRKLLPNELVHHKDEDKLNNDPENLELKEWGAHSVDHNTGSKRSEYTKNTMEVVANYRWELSRVNSLNAELLEALEGLTKYFEFMIKDPNFHEYVNAKQAIKKAINGN